MLLTPCFFPGFPCLRALLGEQLKRVKSGPLRKKTLILILFWFVVIFGKKNMALLFKKFLETFLLSKSVFGYFKTKKMKKNVPMTTKLERGRGR